jgi:hypothetical protein
VLWGEDYSLPAPVRQPFAYAVPPGCVTTPEEEFRYVRERGLEPCTFGVFDAMLRA